MRKMTASKKTFKYLFGFFLICLGVVIGIAIRHYYDIPVEQTINIIDVATLVTTIFLAVYIPGVLDRQMQIKQDKKDLIERRIDEFQALYRKVNMLVQQEANTPKDKLTIKNTLDILRHRLETIIRLLSYFEAKIAVDKEIEQIKALSLTYHHLLFTKELDDENFRYSKQIQDKEELLYNEIDKATCLLIFKFIVVR